MATPAPLLMIMARAPEPGRVKTRLAAEFGNETALGLHVAMLADTLDLARRSAACFRRVAVGWASESGVVPPPGCVSGHPDFGHESQGGGSLGDRLSRAFARELPSGAVICIGTDSPSLPDEFLRSAAGLVVASGARAVLGPAVDGGYYLVGLSSWAPSLFEGIDWGTGRVLAQSLRQAQRDGFEVSLLPPWYDIDRPEDLRLLADAGSPDAARAPRTAEAVRRILEGAGT